MANGWMVDRAKEVAEAGRLARQAVRLGRDDAVALSMAGFTLACILGDLDGGDALIERALLLNPNFTWALYFSCFAKAWLGESELAIDRSERALRLSPNDPYDFLLYTATALAHFGARRYANALSLAQTAAQARPDFSPALVILAASRVMCGQQQPAETTMTLLRALRPAFRIADLPPMYPFRSDKTLVSLVEALRKSGLPE